MSARELLVVIVPATRRDDVVDLLMASNDIDGFTRSEAAGFSRQHSHFSLRESVQGFVDQERFEIVCDPALVDGFLKQLGSLAGRDSFFFWGTSLTREGTINNI